MAVDQIYLLLMFCWFTFNCLTDCLPGYYGDECDQSCSGHCLNNLVCNHIDGTCSGGCEAGYIHELCNTCKILHSPGFYILGYSFANDYNIYSHRIFFSN